MYLNTLFISNILKYLIQIMIYFKCTGCPKTALPEIQKIKCFSAKVTVMEWNGRKQYIPNVLEYGYLIFIRFGSFSCLIKVSETNG